MEVIQNNKRRVKICYQGHMYTKQVTRRQNIRWRCVRRTTWCKGTMTTDLNMENPQAANEHNHEADEATVSATKCVQSMKEKARTTQDKPSVIYADSLQDTTEDTRANMQS